MSPTDFALLGAFLFSFALVSRRIEGTLITPPMVFVLVGLVIGPWALGWIDIDLNEGVLHVLAELTLVFVLFSDATRIDLVALRREVGLPVRLLAVGLPVSIALGAIMAKWLLPELGWWEAATLGAILAPTDAALGQAVVSNPIVPLRIRQALNVESGLNDGFALPFVLVCASLASMSQGEARTANEWIQFAALQVTLGPVVGIAVAWLGGILMQRATAAGYVLDSFERLAGLAVALLCFAGAELVGGNGFLAAFVGGLTLGATQKHHCTAILAFLEAEGQLLMLLVFLGLGASLTVPAMQGASVRVVGYALVSLTVVRMIPTSFSLLGSGLRPASHAFLGWFGPRGLASLLYAIILLSDAALPHADLVFGTVVITTLFSVFLHGVSAAPGAIFYGRIAQDQSTCPAEHASVSAHPLRRSHA